MNEATDIPGAAAPTRFGLKRGEAGRTLLLVTVSVIVALGLVGWAGWAAYEARLARRAGQLPRLPVYLGRDHKGAERLVGPYYERSTGPGNALDRKAGVTRQVRYSLTDLDKARSDGSVQRPSSELVLGLDDGGKVVESTLILTKSAKTHFKRQRPQDVARRVGFSGAVDLVTSYTDDIGIAVVFGYARAGSRWHEFSVSRSGTWEVRARAPKSNVDDAAKRKQAIAKRRASLVDEFSRLNARAIGLGSTPLVMPPELRTIVAQPGAVPEPLIPPAADDPGPLPPARTGTHAGEEMYLVIAATAETRAEAERKLEELARFVGIDGNTFSVDRSEHFQGLEPGYWVVAEGSHELDVANAEVERSTHGKFEPYVHEPVWKTCDDPITVVGP